MAQRNLFDKLAFRFEISILRSLSRPLGLIGGSVLALGVLGKLEPGLAQTLQLVGTLERPAKPQGVEWSTPTVEAAKMINHSTAEIITQQRTLTLRGTAPPGATLKLYFYARSRRQDLQTMVLPDGTWSISIATPLPEGRQQMYLEAISPTDSRRRSGIQLILLVDRKPPTVQVQVFRNNQTTALVAGSLLTGEDRLLGQVDGTGSPVSRLTYRLDPHSRETPLPVSADGLFNKVLMVKGLAPGKHRLMLMATDEAGNQGFMGPYFLTVGGATNRLPRESLVLLVRLLQDSGRHQKLVWTNKPDVVGYVVGAQKVTQLEGRLLPRLVSELPSKNQNDQPLEDNHIRFQEMTPLLQPNGTFWLKDDFLRQLDYANLDDGPYTLELRGRTEDTTQFLQRLEFVLDRTPPDLQLSNFDGIAWEWGTRLQGSLHENLSVVQVDYQFVRQKDRAVASKGSFKVQERRLDLLLPELVKTNRKLEEEEVYFLLLKVSDLAGNSQSLQYSFFIPGDRRVIDDDVLTPKDRKELEQRRRR